MAKKEAKGKKQRNPRKPSKHYAHYKDGKKPKFCPKCGKGVAMGQHKDRTSCGKCSYTEFKKA